MKLLSFGTADFYSEGLRPLGYDAHEVVANCDALQRRWARAPRGRGPIGQPPTASPIPDWSSFRLDVSPDGAIVKPDSLFKEAIKPSEAVGGQI